MSYHLAPTQMTKNCYQPTEHWLRDIWLKTHTPWDEGKQSRQHCESWWPGAIWHQAISHHNDVYLPHILSLVLQYIKIAQELSPITQTASLCSNSFYKSCWFYPLWETILHLRPFSELFLWTVFTGLWSYSTSNNANQQDAFKHTNKESHKTHYN